MKKKLFSILLTCCLIVTLIPGVAMAGEGSLSNFTKTQTYKTGQFTDLGIIPWVVEAVSTAYELGLVKGNSATTYNPNGSVTIAETVTIACRLHSIYYNDGASFPVKEPWYQAYVDYAASNNIIKAGEYSNFNTPATRAQFATILCAAFPDEALAQKNTVNSIPDVPSTASYAASVYKLYRAGILAGNDAKGTFLPSSNIKRSEVAAIITRMALKEKRLSVNLSGDTKYQSFPVTVADTSDFKVVITGQSSSSEYYSWNITLQNKTQKAINFYLENIAINGAVNPVLWDCDVAAGGTVNTTVDFEKEKLADFNITDPKAFRGKLYVSSSQSSSEGDIAVVSFDFATGIAINGSIPSEAKLMATNGTYSIYYYGAGFDDYDTFMAGFFFKSTSGEDKIINVESAKLNGYSIDPCWLDVLLANSIASGVLLWDDDSTSEFGITTVKSMEIVFEVLNEDTFEAEWTKTVTISL